MKIFILSIELNWVYRLYHEYLISIQQFLNEYYKDIFITLDYYDKTNFNEGTLNLISFSHYDKILYTGSLDYLFLLNKKLENNSFKLYYINIEQLSHSSYYTLFRNIDKNINIIDYSEENINYLKGIYPNYFLIPPYFKYKDINILQKNIDILTIDNNDYRKNIINNIKNINDSFNIIKINDCYHMERNQLFDQTKIYINIHCSEEHLTMELIRIVNLIFRKVIVISQKSVFTEILFLKKYIIIFNDNEIIEDYLNEILNNYEYYFHSIYDDFDEKAYYYFIKENMDKFLNIF